MLVSKITWKHNNNKKTTLSFCSKKRGDDKGIRTSSAFFVLCYVVLPFVRLEQLNSNYRNKILKLEKNNCEYVFEFVDVYRNALLTTWLNLWMYLKLMRFMFWWMFFFFLYENKKIIMMNRRCDLLNQWALRQKY